METMGKRTRHITLDIDFVGQYLTEEMELNEMNLDEEMRTTAFGDTYREAFDYLAQLKEQGYAVIPPQYCDDYVKPGDPDADTENVGTCRGHKKK